MSKGMKFRSGFDILILYVSLLVVFVFIVTDYSEHYIVWEFLF